MAEETPKCEKCGAPIQSGFLFIWCPHKQECALYPKDSPADVRETADEMIRGNQP